MLTVRRNFLASSVKIFLQITVRLVKLPTTWLGQDDVKGKVKKQKNWWVPQCFWKTCYLYHKSSISGFRVLCFVGVMILFSGISWKRITGSSTHVIKTLFFSSTYLGGAKCSPSPEHHSSQPPHQLFIFKITIPSSSGKSIFLPSISS